MGWLPPGSLQRHPRVTLTVLFVGWKLLLLAAVIASPGPGYDTSTTLLLPALVAARDVLATTWRLVRWDAIYFVRVAERDYLYEQEWAFGYGYTRMLKWIAVG
jgi:GPI mannosyltransferase 2